MLVIGKFEKINESSEYLRIKSLDPRLERTIIISENMSFHQNIVRNYKMVYRVQDKDKILAELSKIYQFNLRYQIPLIYQELVQKQNELDAKIKERQTYHQHIQAYGKNKEITLLNIVGLVCSNIVESLNGQYQTSRLDLQSLTLKSLADMQFHVFFEEQSALVSKLLSEISEEKVMQVVLDYNTCSLEGFLGQKVFYKLFEHILQAYDAPLLECVERSCKMVVEGIKSRFKQQLRDWGALFTDLMEFLELYLCGEQKQLLDYIDVYIESQVYYFFISKVENSLANTQTPLDNQEALIKE